MARRHVPEGPLPVGIELVQDLTGLSPAGSGFLRRHRHCIKTVFSDGLRTDTYIADYIDRDASRRDAVAVLVVADGPDRRRHVLLRRQVRYAQSLVTGHPLCLETIAGLIEDGEPPAETVQREIEEEVGLRIGAERIEPLGLPFFALPGTLTERIFPFVAWAELSALERAGELVPVGDGSCFEEGAHQLLLGLDEALGLCTVPVPDDPTELYIADAKTELCLRRLQDRER